MTVNLILPKKKLVFRQFMVGILLVGLMGLVFSGGDLSLGYEVSKTIWLQWWVKLLVICLWWLGITQPQQLSLQFFSHKANLWLFLFIVIILLSAMTGVNLQQSLWGNYYRGDGVITWLHLMSLSFLFRWLVSRQDAKWVVPLAAGLAGLLLFIRILGGEFLAFLQIGFGNANIEAGFLVVVTPLILFGLRKLPWSLRGIFLLVIVLTIVYLQSWGGLLSLCLLIVMWWWLQQKTIRSWVWLAPFLALALGLSSVLVFQPIGNSQATESRLRIVQKLSRAVMQRPYLGWGWANVDTAFESVNWPVAVNDDVYVDKAHSELLEIVITTGVVGLGFYLLFLIRVYLEVINSSRLNSTWKRTLFLVCLVYFFHSQTNVVSVAESAIFWLSLGLLLDV